MAEETQIIEVGVADAKISVAPHILITYALGSCVGIILYDAARRIGGLAHPMLPDITKSVMNSNQAKFVNSVLEMMINSLKAYGCNESSLCAKLFGGATLFTTGISANSDFFNIGERNISMAKQLLNEWRIKLVAEDTGGTYGRTVSCDLQTGRVRVKSIYHGEKEF